MDRASVYLIISISETSVSLVGGLYFCMIMDVYSFLLLVLLQSLGLVIVLLDIQHNFASNYNFCSCCT